MCISLIRRVASTQLEFGDVPHLFAVRPPARSKLGPGCCVAHALQPKLEKAPVGRLRKEYLAPSRGRNKTGLAQMQLFYCPAEGSISLYVINVCPLFALSLVTLFTVPSFLSSFLPSFLPSFPPAFLPSFLNLFPLSTLLQFQSIPHKQTTKGTCEVPRLLLLPRFPAKAIILSSHMSSTPLPFSPILPSPPYDPFLLQLFGCVLMTSVPGMKDAEEGARSGMGGFYLTLWSSVTVETSTQWFSY